MVIIGIDFETYYAKDYSLSKISTQAYVDHPHFEVIGVAVRVNDEPTEWFSGTMEETQVWLSKFDWANAWVYAHNAMFDATILTWRFGIKPKLWIDTLSMARAVHGTEVGGSLAKLAIHYGLGEKGTEVVNALGKRRVDFTEEDLDKYGEYCINDVDLTYGLFLNLAPHFNKTEMKLIDMTIRMHSEPQFILDIPTLEDHLYHTKKRKEELLSASGIAKEDLMSNNKFADILRSYGVTPPLKISPATGKETYAFAKTDEEMKELLDFPDFDVQAIVAARLGTKSTLEESRTERFIEIANAGGAMPIPLKYYGADVTGRWSGCDGVNMQNLPRSSPIKHAIQAPEGYVIVGADLSNIELRVSLYFSGQMDKLQIIADGLDLYKAFAATAFKVGYDEVTKEQRFVGKTCIAEGTPVLCESGWKLIEEVTTNDKLWDGEEWVCHQGLVNNGYKKTLELYGTSLTPDHLVWLGTHWKEAQYLKNDLNILLQALVIGAGNLPLQAISKDFEALRRSLLNATAVKKSTLWTTITLKTLKVLDVVYVLKKQLIKKGIGYILWPFLMIPIEQDYSIDCLQPSPDATIRVMPTTNTMGKEAYMCFKSGEKTKQFFLGMFRHWTGGISQSLRWIGWIITKDTNQTTLDLCPVVVTSKTNDKSQTLKTVYDILNCGSRNRFTILTDNGPLIVHNCILGLGFGTGAAKLRESIRAMSGNDIGKDEAERIVNLYRSEFDKVKATWNEGTQVLRDMRDNVTSNFGAINLKVMGKRGILLPSGLYLKYPDLIEQDEWTYSSHRGSRRKIYGGKVVQNCIQSLARCIMGEAMMRITRRYKIALTIHDSCYCVVPKEEAQEAFDFIIGELCKEPRWMPGIPLGAEGAFGVTLKEAG